MAPPGAQTIPILQGKREQEAAEADLAINALNNEFKERERYVALLLQREDFDAFDASPTEVAQRLYDIAEALVKEANRRNLVELSAELKRLGRPVSPALKLLFERHGVAP